MYNGEYTYILESVYWIMYNGWCILETESDYLRMYNGGCILESVYAGKCFLESVQYIGEVPAGERNKVKFKMESV